MTIFAPLRLEDSRSLLSLTFPPRPSRNCPGVGEGVYSETEKCRAQEDEKVEVHWPSSHHFAGHILSGLLCSPERCVYASDVNVTVYCSPFENVFEVVSTS
ncbi:hypothetical protein J6590_092515 [Homalodisca vitripennis]|nr:hypothetical protein J6590_047261 [Homalodisca vitripennis]KAG8294896.1 hypothetical protein J6590_092515 [Homalodisca vitripennis]